MSQAIVQFVFHRSVPMDEVEGTLRLAHLATASLYGETCLRLDAKSTIDTGAHRCAIQADNYVGRALALIFAGFIRREFGDTAMKIAHTASTHVGERTTKSTG